MSSLRQRLQFTSVIDNSIKHPVINNSKRSTQKFTTSSRIILSISVLATIILSSYYFGTDTHSRVVTPLPIAELHRKRGNLQVYDMDKAHFIWSKRSDESIFTKLKPWQRHNQMPGRVFNKTRSDFPCHLNETEEKTKGLMSDQTYIKFFINHDQNARYFTSSVIDARLACAGNAISVQKFAENRVL